MEIKVKVNIGSTKGCFQVRQEGPGIYIANLVTYNGEENKRPPGKITLIRGARQWTGSIDDEVLLNALGTQIERQG